MNGVHPTRTALYAQGRTEAEPRLRGNENSPLLIGMIGEKVGCGRGRILPER